MTSRRSVLLGLTALVAAPAVVRASSLMRLAPPLRLHGDGVQDDASALQAYLDGWTVSHSGNIRWSPDSPLLKMPPGIFRITRPLVVVRDIISANGNYSTIYSDHPEIWAIEFRSEHLKDVRNFRFTKKLEGELEYGDPAAVSPDRGLADLGA